VHQRSGVNYECIDDGLHISFGSGRERRQVLPVDNMLTCAGHDPRDLEDGLRRNGIDQHITGGAALPVEVDAKRAIKQGTAGCSPA
jgi:2,4-dienoyl-CoA reductase (NADPH2)